MKKIDIEEYRKKKEEYDKKILELDYKVVEKSVQLYNAKSANNEELRDNRKVEDLSYEINKLEEEKKKQTETIWNNIKELKSETKNIIETKLKQGQNTDKEQLITSLFIINKITDVYFNIDELQNLLYLFDTDVNSEKPQYISSEKTNQYINYQNVTIANNLQPNIIHGNNIPSANYKTKVFDIKEERIIDFENLLNVINELSENYRRDVSNSLDRFINNYNLVNNSEYLKVDFDNITNNYNEIYKSNLAKFQKDENIENLKNRIKKSSENENDINKKIQDNNLQIQDKERKIQELQNVYFVSGYTKKILAQVIEGEANIENTNLNKEEKPDDTFNKIKDLAYNKRLKHIVNVSNWTKGLEEKLNNYKLKENDFQFVIYLIRQTQNICNANFEQVANLIIQLCDINIQLEAVETVEKSKNKKLQNYINTNNILSQGIDAIRKKYSKIPFIGRKVGEILNAKMLN